MDKNEERRLQREKRLARIRDGQGSRLAKITGVAGTEDYKSPISTLPRSVDSTSASTLSPAPSEQSTVSETLVNPTETVDNVAPDADKEPGDDVPSTFDVSFGGESPLNAQAVSNDPLLNFLQQQNDPLFAMLANNDSNANISSEATRDQPKQPNAAQMQAQMRSSSRAKAEFAWDFVYFLSSVILGLYAARVDPWFAPKLFVAGHVAMLGVRIVLGHHVHGLPLVSMLAPFASMLSASRQRQLNAVAGAIGALWLAYWSLAVVIFVYALASGGGAQFSRLS